MARRKTDSPQKAALREMMSNYLKEIDVPSDRKGEFVTVLFSHRSMLSKQCLRLLMLIIIAKV